MFLQKMRLKWFLYVLAFLLANPSCTVLRQDSNIIRPAKSLPATIPWDLIALSKVPHYQWSQQGGQIWSLFYEEQNYKGKPKRVFAYYATPASTENRVMRLFYVISAGF